ncbi:NUDIX domain-containing protein [Cellulomonas alba]|uniref:NUDIX domain-containing protein n=1 Tax=Cellulomonas alba TaxID=3053467 RepID=A0ABT7SHQ6_9CELL|nr:NUDIX domain-containing protein [Cellulomonas alba]MDM7855718.1 NUDIX domain-containing protein [Cellulomonas alba]
MRPAQPPDLPSVPAPPQHPHHRQPGDGWVECACGRRHWGLFGAAGLLLARYPDGRTGGAPDAIVLQHRAPWSDQGGTWGVPGGARNPDEPAVDAALREAAEEAGIDPADVVVLGTSVLHHPDWSYTTVLARERVPGAVEPAVTDPESVEIRWVRVGDVEALPLLPAFAEAWPDLLGRLTAGA